MEKLTGLSNEDIIEIAHQIADAFYDYNYHIDDEGLCQYITSRDAMFTYIHAIVKAAYKSGLLFTTTPKREGYLMLSGSDMKIGLKDSLQMILAENQALGGLANMKAFITACMGDGGTIETRMRRAKRPFIRVEMLVVRKEYQHQGFMKQMLEEVYAMADAKHLPVILDTDDKDKAERYVHLGMTLERVRNCGKKLHMYDLIREGLEERQPDYKNWIPKGMIYGFAAATAAGIATTIIVHQKVRKMKTPLAYGATATCAALTIGCGAMTTWCLGAYKQFAYDGQRQLSKQIVEGTAAYVTLPEGGVGLDVGCGSGALTIACAKRNPQGSMIGIDRWGKEYASFSQSLCVENAKAEDVRNVTFLQGDATHLDFADETFDVVTSNYVYHNIVGINKQQLLKETLRVLKKGGTFAIHDLMSKNRYGDMAAFVKELKAEGYEDVQLICTDQGMFMSKKEALLMMLKGSMLLVGKK